MNYLIFGNTDSRRAKEWEKAIGNNPFELVTFQAIASGQFPSISVLTTVRITSPGENFETFRLLVSLGGYADSYDLDNEKGRILLHAYWYKGWSLILDKIQAFLAINPLAKVMNDPLSIKQAFNKPFSQQMLRKAGIPVPKIYCQQLTGFKQLLQIMEDNGLSRVFLKPAHGSSASGVMMFRKSANKMLLETTIHLVKEGREPKLFNHLRLQRYQNIEDIKTIVELMIPNHLHAEQWIRKKRFQSKSTDFRVVIINKQPIFVQPRHSNHPITNLHLDNEKGVIETLENAWSSLAIDKVRTIAVDVATVFSGLFYAGIDIALDEKDNPYVLEINPFGDFLKDIYIDQKNTYEFEFSAWKNKVVQ